MSFWILAIASSLMLAVILTRVSPFAAFAAIASLATALLVLRRPEAGVLLLICLVAALPHHLLFEQGIPFFGGALKVTDLLLVLITCSWAAAVLTGRRSRMPSRLTSFLLVSILALACLGVVTARGHGTPTKTSLLELRPLLSFLLVFPVVSGLRNLREARKVLGLFLVACAMAGIETVWRYVHGQGGVASYTGGAIRVGDSLFMFPMLAAIWVVVLLPASRTIRVRVALGLLGLLSVTALFFTFQRGAWLAFLAALAVILLRMKPVLRRRLVLAIVPLLLAVAAGIVVLNGAALAAANNPLHSGLTRLGSVLAFNHDVSGQYRIAEWTAAGKAILEHPLNGIGLGSQISFWSPMYSDSTYTMGGPFSTYYIHNSYVWFALKLGLPAAALFLALLVLQVVRAGRYARRWESDESSSLALGALGSLVALLVVSITGPHLNADFSTPYIAAVLGLVEVYPRLASSRVTRAAKPAGRGRVGLVPV